MVFLALGRRRLLFWLMRAYVKRWGKTLLFFFVLGIFLAIIVFKFLPKIFNLINNTQKIALVGSYTIDTLPLEIQQKISLGLTKTEVDGQVSPAIAKSWEISPDGKAYTLYLRHDIYFQDGKKLKAEDINYQFKEASSEVLNDETVKFELNEPFSPFLTVISQPIFKKGLVGVGEYKIKKIEFNGNFISLLALGNVAKKQNPDRIIYYFYPTKEAAKTAFILGEVNTIQNLYNISGFENWKNLEIKKSLNSQELVAIFFNTRDPLLSGKNIRQALIYALPDNFEEGEVASSPLSFRSFAFQKQTEKFIQDINHAKELLGSDSSSSEKLLNLKTDQKLESLAKKISQDWEKIGLKTNIEVTSGVPSNFQAFLGIYRIPADPDQYVLWHSTQTTNLTGYVSQKIDKLLEDGRKTQDRTEREKIYADFQKYLVDDAPAAFLYYPAIYTTRRK